MYYVSGYTKFRGMFSNSGPVVLFCSQFFRFLFRNETLKCFELKIGNVMCILCNLKIYLNTVCTYYS